MDVIRPALGIATRKLLPFTQGPATAERRLVAATSQAWRTQHQLQNSPACEEFITKETVSSE